MKRLACGFLVLTGCIVMPNNEATLRIVTDGGQVDTIHIVYFNSLDIDCNENLVDGVNRVQAKFVIKYSFIGLPKTLR